MDVCFSELFGKVYSRLDLSLEESKKAASSILEGSWEVSQTSAFLATLHMKGETAEELAGFAMVARDKAVTVPPIRRQTIDTSGTGGDHKGAFNISTVTGLVLAGCEIPVVKQGGEAASECGSAELLAALGIRHRLLPDEIATALEKTGFAFLYVPDYHPATRFVASLQRQVRFPNIFSLIAPLTNPAHPAAQLIGVYDREALSRMAGALRILDPNKRVTLVHGLEGWDEATTCCDFLIHAPNGEESWVNARIFGFPEASAADLRGGSPEENACCTMAMLEGQRGPRRDTVLLNAMLAAMAYYPDCSDREALSIVTKSLDSGAVLNVVKKLQSAFPAEQ